MAPEQPGRLRVLVVEDDADSADMLSTLLALFGHQVRVERDAAGGLQALAEFLPDVAVLDIGLPKMDGYEMARRVRRTDGFENLPLIAISGWGTSEDVERAHQAGFDHHLTKPASPDRLESLLKDIAARRDDGSASA